MTRAERSAIAARRRESTLKLRAEGLSWVEIGERMELTPSRVRAIAIPVPVKPPRPKRTVPGSTRLVDYIDAQAERVRQSVEAVTRQVAAMEGE